MAQEDKVLMEDIKYLLFQLLMAKEEDKKQQLLNIKSMKHE